MNTSRPGAPFTLGFMVFLIALAGTIALGAIWARAHAMDPDMVRIITLASLAVSLFAMWQTRRQKVLR
jgi:hypothetical protein